MEFTTCSGNDINAIIDIYDRVRHYQLKNNFNVYAKFEIGMIKQEIEEGKYWKILIEEKMACIFLLTYNDAIWDWRDNNDSIYIHRIAIDPIFKGRKLLAEIINWVKGLLKKSGRRYIRIDTWQGNEKLISYYMTAGFSFVGNKIVSPDPHIPAYKWWSKSSLLEIYI